jgi:hypothetical protein
VDCTRTLPFTVGLLNGYCLSRTQPFFECARWGYPLVPRSKPTPIAVGTWKKSSTPRSELGCPEVYFRVLAKMWGSRELSRDVTRISRETRGCHVRCVYSATRDYSAMLRWAAVYQRRPPTSLPTTWRSLGTLRDRSLGTLRDRSLRCARYFVRKAAPMLTGSLEQTFITDCGLLVTGLPSGRPAAFLSAPVILCRVGVHFYNRPAACGARRGGSAAQRPDSPTAERRIECGWQSIYVDSRYVLSSRLCFADRNHIWGPWSSFEAAVRL